MRTYFELNQQVTQLAPPQPQHGVALAFTSALSGEGVSHVARAFAHELARHSVKRIALVTLAGLQQTVIETVLPQQALQQTQDNLWELVPRQCEGSACESWQRDHGLRQATLTIWRRKFDYVLLDCPALRTSPAAAVLAPLLDGVALVVEAGRTRRADIQFAQRMLAGAQANLLGLVLNKRRYPVPAWLYRWL
jgi:Mrp family chromosome partitioning ATPase